MSIDESLKIRPGDSNTGKDLDIKLDFKKLYDGSAIAFKVSNEDIEAVEKIANDANIPYTITKKTTLDLLLNSMMTLTFGFMFFFIFLFVMDINKILGLNITNEQYKIASIITSLILTSYAGISAARKGAKENNYVEVNRKKWKIMLKEKNV